MAPLAEDFVLNFEELNLFSKLFFSGMGKQKQQGLENFPERHYYRKIKAKMGNMAIFLYTGITSNIALLERGSQAIKVKNMPVKQKAENSVGQKRGKTAIG